MNKDIPQIKKIMRQLNLVLEICELLFRHEAQKMTSTEFNHLRKFILFIF